MSSPGIIVVTIGMVVCLAARSVEAGPATSCRPNVFGGRDTTVRNGTRSTSRPNIFDGFDDSSTDGAIRSRPNVFGGMD